MRKSKKTWLGLALAEVAVLLFAVATKLASPMWASHAPHAKPGSVGWRDTRPMRERLLSPSPMPGSFEGHPENLAGWLGKGPGEMAGGVGDIAQGNIARGGH